ncbi:MAG: RNA polymerase sigma factor [Bacteroidales bacterium]|jgi:RNA polymerase sigma-70 factor (ECF subfamily)|nr:RNA polymerase sigma factor [Bacteroidales bacterium]
MQIRQEIIESCKIGDQRAQQQLYDLCAPSLLAVCCRYATNRDDAEDMLIEGFIKLFNHAKEYDKKAGSFYVWSKTIMVNTAIDWLRKHGKHNTFNAIDVVTAEELGLFNAQARQKAEEEAVMRDEETQLNIEPGTDTARIMQEIKQMPEHLRIVFNLHLLEEYSYSEIEVMLNLKQTTIRSRFSKAMRWLNNRFNAEDKK